MFRMNERVICVYRVAFVASFRTFRCVRRVVLYIFLCMCVVVCVFVVFVVCE